MHTQPIVAGVTSPPPPSASTGYVEFEVGANQLYHIPDDQGRRLIEGWASLRGIDWQDEEILPESFERGAMDYLSKNPVLLWDHKRHIPIGKVRSLTITDDGLFMQAEIFAPTEEDTERLQQLNSLSEGYDSYLLKANEVWWGVQQGQIRGLSVSGRTRRRAVFSPELNKYIHQGVETLIHEISITPTQVHPGSRITGVNTLAKALELTKALPLIYTRTTMNEKQKKAFEAQTAYLAALKELGDGAELPQEMVEVHKALSTAIADDPQPEKKEVAVQEQPDITALIVKAIADQLSPIQEQINKLANVPAPIKAKTSLVAPEGASVKPLTEQNESNAIEKALGIVAMSKNGRANLGDGEFHGVDGVEAIKFIMARSQSKRRPLAMFDDSFPRNRQGISLTDHSQRLIQKCMAG